MIRSISAMQDFRSRSIFMPIRTRRVPIPDQPITRPRHGIFAAPSYTPLVAAATIDANRLPRVSFTNTAHVVQPGYRAADVQGYSRDAACRTPGYADVNERAVDCVIDTPVHGMRGSPTLPT